MSTPGLGLGITFLPSPSLRDSAIVPIHLEPALQRDSTPGLHHSSQKQQLHQKQLRPEQSYYDVEKQVYAKSRTASGPIESTSLSGLRTGEMRGEGGTSKAKNVERMNGDYRGGGKDDIELDYRKHALSPLSEFDDATSSDEQSSFSPASISSLPSSTSSVAAYFPHYHAPPVRTRELRYAQSMVALPSASDYQRTPPTVPQHPRLPTPPLQIDVAPMSTSRSPSRLPAFLVDRTRKEALARPKSMMELSNVATQFSPSNDVDMIHRDRVHAFSKERRDRREVDDRSESSRSSAGVYSPESIPSSAGGLVQQKLERQLQERHASNQETSREQHDMQQQHNQQSNSDIPLHDPPHPLHHHSSRSHLRSHSDSTTSTSHTAPRYPDPTRLSPAKSSLHLDHASPLNAAGSKSGLNRAGTLFSAGSNPGDRSRELDRVLAPSGIKKVPSFSQLSATVSASKPRSVSRASTDSRLQQSLSNSSFTNLLPLEGPVLLEQAKSTSKARVELDLVLESSLLVEGGTMRGKIELRVRRVKDDEPDVWIGTPKVRVVGFEELTNYEEGRYVFYHHGSPITRATNSKEGSPSLSCFDSIPDGEGFSKGRIGQHNIPFGIALPIGKGAKGSWKGKQGVVRYIVIVSVKLKSHSGADRSIAHFYRHVEIFPYLNPAIILASALKPLIASTSKALFMGGNGLVHLTGKLHRTTWIAGQRCYVDVSVENDSSKKIKTLTLTLVRTTTVFRPRSDAAVGDGNVVAPSQATKKKVAETTLEMGKKAGKGVTAKGSWMGVDRGERTDFAHFILVPSEELSIGRGRHLEVSYSIKMAVSGSLSADVVVEIPIRVINFVSIDPPPGHTGELAAGLPKLWNIDQITNPMEQEPPSNQPPLNSVIDQMVTMDTTSLSELNLKAGQESRQSLAQIGSSNSLPTLELPHLRKIRSDSSSEKCAQAGTVIGRDVAVIEKARERSLQHQMSLDCISTAIASATARRGVSVGSSSGQRSTRSGLRLEIERTDGDERWDENEEEKANDEDPYDGATYSGGGEQSYARFGLFECLEGYGQQDEGIDEVRVQLDDLDDDVDVSLDNLGSRPAACVEDDASSSEDDLEAVMRQACLDEDEAIPTTLHAPVSPSRHQQQSTFSSFSPVRSQIPSSISPTSGESGTKPLKSALKQRSDVFAFATPASPVRASNSPSLQTSSIRRQPSRPDLSASPLRRQQSRPDLPPIPIRHLTPRSNATLSSSPTTMTAPTAAKASTTPRGLVSKRSTSSLRRIPEITMVRKPTSGSLRPVSLISNTSSPDIDSVSTRSSSDNESTKSSSDRYSSDTRSVAVNRVAYTRNVGERQSSKTGATNIPATNFPTRKNSILPSIRSQVAAYDSREEALAELRSTSTPGYDGRSATVSLSRADSILSVASEGVNSMLSREDSVKSFKAPIFRQEHREI